MRLLHRNLRRNPNLSRKHPVSVNSRTSTSASSAVNKSHEKSSVGFYCLPWTYSQELLQPILCLDCATANEAEHHLFFALKHTPTGEMMNIALALARPATNLGQNLSNLKINTFIRERAARPAKERKKHNRHHHSFPSPACAIGRCGKTNSSPAVNFRRFRSIPGLMCLPVPRPFAFTDNNSWLV